MILPQPAGPSQTTLVEITRYPVKSCRRESLQQAVVEPWGLQGDRRWMLVDSRGVTVTARECRSLVLVVPELTTDGLLLRAPGREALRVTRPDGGRLVAVDVWGTEFRAALAADEASEWFSSYLQQDVRLVFLDDPTRRQINPRRSRPGEVVSLADGYPLLLASAESLAALNDWVSEGARAADGPVPITRFRPNLLVSGAPAWAEDTWRRVSIGGSAFRAVKACDRCVLTLIDPETGQRTKEPLYSLARHRKWDHKTWFGVNLIPDDPGGTLRVGDPVEVLEQVDEHEPQR